MEWPIILVLAIAIPIILFPAAYIWYLNAGGLYAALKESRLRVPRSVVRAARLSLIIGAPLAAYSVLIWFLAGTFGWVVALVVALTLPIVFIAPVLIWAAVVSGLYQVVRDTLRRRAAVRTRRATRLPEEIEVTR